MKNRAKVGLSLSGGAMRGLAHIGVLEVLEENNIPIDMIAGTSMGAAIGAVYASGMRISLMRAFCEKITLAESRKFFDLSIPKMGMLRGRRIEELIFTLTGGKNIEELNIPFVAAACCIEDGKSVHFKEGSTVKAIRASIAIPGIFEPVIIDEKTYVDGGVLERCPVQILKEMGADYIICSDVNYRGGNNETPKNVFNVLLTVYGMMEWQAMSQIVTDVDISITSNTREMSPVSFADAEECMNIGNTAALEKIDEIKMALNILNKSKD
ncbi:MAG: patatin-like phospholipase family protein [Clostridiales bacterium]|nr:patatin-like phospholipase family protein [Clostridiales bacterium]